MHWLVLGGCPRSGTTLLNFTLNSHEDIYLSNEQNLYKSCQILDTMFYRQRHVEKRKPRTLSNSEAVTGGYKAEVKAATISKEKSLTPMIEAAFYTSLCPSTSDPNSVYVGDKFPKYYHWDIEWLEKYISNIKFIHVSRSPVDVISSCMRRTELSKKGEDWWPIENISDYVNEWIRAWNYINTKKENPNFLHIRYEDFTSSPSLVCTKISEFLGIVDAFSPPNVYDKANAPNKKQSYYAAELAKYLPDPIVSWNQDLTVLESTYGYISSKAKPNLLDLANKHFHRQKKKYIKGGKT